MRSASRIAEQGRARRRGTQWGRRPTLERMEDRTLLSAGDLDLALGGTGKVLTNFGSQVASYDAATAVLSLADGKLLVAGQSNGAMALARYNVDGALDTSFGTGGKVLTVFAGANDMANCVVVQSDGKILAAGSTSDSGGGSAFALARYNTNGTLDTTFGTGGLVTTLFAGAASAEITSVVLQSGGQIVAVGAASPQPNQPQDFALARYNANGTLDTTFGTGGQVLTDINNGSDDAASDVILQGGKLLVVGASDSDFALARYNADGTLDTTFGTGGKTITDIGSGSFDAASAAVLQGGKILVAGSSNNDFALVRYSADGKLDTTFGTSGKTITDYSNNSVDTAYGLVLQNDGKILAAGSANGNFALARYSADGKLDTTFGTGGKATASVTSSSFPVNVALQPSGKIVLAGTSFAGAGNGDFMLAHYTTSGALDTTFGTSGKAITNFGTGYADTGGDVAVQNDGKILVVGSSIQKSTNSSDFALARYNTNGALDTTFGTGGKVLTDFGGGAYDFATSVIVLSSGKILVGGVTMSATTGLSDFALARYNTNGTLDTTFGTGGKVTTNFGDADTLTGVFELSGGKLLVIGQTTQSTSGTGTGSTTGDFALARYNTNGTLDTTFGTGGKVTTNFGTSAADYPSCVAVQSDGKILVGGDTTAADASTADFALARYNTNGALDSTFGTGGKVITDVNNGSDDYINGLVVLTSGKILAVGSSDSSVGLARYNTNGALDSTFGTGGKVLTTVPGFSGYVADVQVEADGKLLVLSSDLGFSAGGNHFSLARLTPDGALDGTFGTGGAVLSDFGGSTTTAIALALAPSGSIVVAGSSGQPSTGTVFAVARFKNDVAGYVNHPPTAVAGGPYTIAEGQGLTLDGSKSSDPDTAVGDLIVSYAWDLNGDGKADITSATPSVTVTAAQLAALGLSDGPATPTIALTVTDSNGATGTATTKLTITNVAPTAKLTGPTTGKEGTAISLTASATDPSAADMAAGFTYAWTIKTGTTTVQSGTAAAPSPSRRRTTAAMW